jgi:hypothetical protein
VRGNLPHWSELFNTWAAKSGSRNLKPYCLLVENLKLGIRLIFAHVTTSQGKVM